MACTEQTTQRQKVEGPCQGLGGDAESAFNRDRAPVWEDENIQWVDGGDGRTTALMCLMPLDGTLGNGQDGKFYTMRIYHKTNQN